MELIDCLTDIGGLLGLYVGLSIVDLSDIAKTILTRLITMLESIASIFYFRIMMIKSKKMFKKILIYLRLMKKLPLRYISNIVTTPILIMQLIYLVNEYLQYPTLQGFEYPRFEINVSSTNSKMKSGREFPDISLCHRINIDEVLKNISLDKIATGALNCLDDINDNISPIDYDQAINQFELFASTHNYTHLNHTEYSSSDISQLYEVLYGLVKPKFARISFIEYFDNFNKLFEFVEPKQNEYYAFLTRIFINYIVANSHVEHRMRMEPITNRDKYGLNGTLDMFRFFNIQHRITARAGPRLTDLKPRELSLTPYGMCTTLSPGQQFSDQFIEGLSVYNIFTAPYISYTMIIHPGGTLPVRQLNVFQFERDKNKMIFLSKQTVEKLPSPYDTNCKPNEQDNQHKCITDCYIDKYLDRFKCIPSHSIYLSISLNETNWRFCPKDYQDEIDIIERNIQGTIS